MRFSLFSYNFSKSKFKKDKDDEQSVKQFLFQNNNIVEIEITHSHVSIQT